MRTPRVYGPHDPATAPTHVDTFAGTKSVQIPVHPAIVRQRQQINDLAAGHLPADERSRVEAAVRQLARTGRPFSANDARGLHGVTGGVVGSVFRALRAEGVIEKAGDDVSAAESTHGHRIYLWTGRAAT